MKCVRLRYNKPPFDTPCVLFGVVVGSKNGLIRFRTRNGDHLIPERAILSVEPTEKEYDGELP